MTFSLDIYLEPVLPPTSSMWLRWRECVYSSCVCWKHIGTVAWSYHNVAHSFIPHWTFFSVGVAQLSLTDHGKWEPLLIIPEKELQHNKLRLKGLPSSIYLLPWIPTALTGTQACRAARGWKGRTRMCTKWNLVYPFPDLSHYAAPWMKKMLWWYRRKSHMSITGLMVTFLRLSPKSPCLLLRIQ